MAEPARTAAKPRWDLSTAGGRLKAWLNMQFADHGILRHLWTNMAEIAPGVWRANQPGPARLRRWKEAGFKTVLSLRGTPGAAHYAFEKEACEALGLTLVTTELHARRPASRADLLRLFDLFRRIERPFVMHCKSGADRAGLASALYLLGIENRPLAEARAQLSLRHLHIRQSATGILDSMLDMYEARLERGPIGVEDWIAAEYTPEALDAWHRGAR